jgi:hypothetical protein
MTMTTPINATAVTKLSNCGSYSPSVFGKCIIRIAVEPALSDLR